MLRKLTLLAVIALLVCPVWADDTKGDKSDEKKQDKPKDEAERKKADKYLGIDWGDENKKKDEEKKDDPDAKKPSKEIDLSTALAKARQKRLEVILKDADKARKLSDEAGQAAAGTHKRIKKSKAADTYSASGKKYLKVIKDLESLAKLVKEEDVRLTLLQTHRDPMKDNGCEAFCKGAHVEIDQAKSPKDLKKAIVLIGLARKINPKYPGIEEATNAVREKYRDMLEKIKQAKADRASGGGEKKEDSRYEGQDPREDRDFKNTGREDYKKTGR